MCQFLTWKKYIKSFSSHSWDVVDICVVWKCKDCKTALIQRYEKDEFITDYSATLNDSRTLSLFVHKQNRLNMKLMDTAGMNIPYIRLCKIEY